MKSYWYIFPFNNTVVIYSPWTINDNGIIEWKNIPVGFHFAIYEGDGMFSDCTRLVKPPHPTLRIRTMTDLQKNPDFVLRLEQTFNTNEK